MKIVWERDRSTVRDVYEALLERRKVAYTTVMTMMKILEQKKYLKKILADRAYVYRPAQPKGQVIGDMVRDFVNRVFNGSAEPLAGAPGPGARPFTGGTGRDCAFAEAAMNLQLIWDNLVAYSMQIGLLVGLAAFIPTALRLRLPASRLAYWHILLAACLLLPAVRPWKQAVITLSVFVPTPITAHVPSRPAAAPALSPTEIALILLGCRHADPPGLARHRLLAPGPPAPPIPAAPPRFLLGRGGRHPCLRRNLEPGDLRLSAPGRAAARRISPNSMCTVQEAILCHEILHVRRRDWLFTLAEELIRSIFWFHPAIWWLLGEIGLAREQVVDRQVVELTRSRDQYVDALLAIAGAKPRLDLAPAPLFLRKRHLKQRVVSIMKEVRMSKTRSVSSLAAGLGIMALACWFVTATFPLAAAPQMVADGPGVTVDAGGTVMHRAGIVYPDAARANRVQGVVTVEATIDSSGNVVDTRVLSGPIELRRAAQQSVLTWHFAMDTSMNTRLVKMNFELPAQSAQPAAMPAPGAPMDAASRAAVEEKLRAVRSQMELQARQAQDPATRQQTMAENARTAELP